MWVKFGKPKEFVQLFNKLFAADMFELFRNFMDFIPIKSQCFGQEDFPYTVATQQGDGNALS